MVRNLYDQAEPGISFPDDLVDGSDSDCDRCVDIHHCHSRRKYIRPLSLSEKKRLAEKVAWCAKNLARIASTTTGNLQANLLQQAIEDRNFAYGMDPELEIDFSIFFFSMLRLNSIGHGSKQGSNSQVLINCR